jgi:membrane protease subunit HflK
MPQGPRPAIPRFSGRVVLLAVVVVLAILVVLTSFYTIKSEEVGVVLRFGRYLATTDPGLHAKMPLGIDQVLPVPVLRQEKQEFGFRTLQAGVKTTYSGKSFDEESLMVTGDLNAASVEWIIQYRIHDPKAYLFDVRNAEVTLRDASEAVMRKVVGDHTVDEVLTVGRQEISADARTKLQALMDEYRIGIRIEQVLLQSVSPPEPVKASFNEVNQAQQELERMINEARADYNRVIPRAAGVAQQRTEEAEGYALQRVNQAEGDAANFNAVYAEYRKAPEVTRRRIYLETMAEVIPKIGQKYIVDEQTQGILPLLQLKAEEVAKP